MKPWWAPAFEMEQKRKQRSSNRTDQKKVVKLGGLGRMSQRSKKYRGSRRME